MSGCGLIAAVSSRVRVRYPCVETEIVRKSAPSVKNSNPSTKLKAVPTSRRRRSAITPPKKQTRANAAPTSDSQPSKSTVALLPLAGPSRTS